MHIHNNSVLRYLYNMAVGLLFITLRCHFHNVKKIFLRSILTVRSSNFSPWRIRKGVGPQRSWIRLQRTYCGDISPS